MNLKTPLHAEHVALGAKMCPFAGYDMPIHYALGVIKEHEWTREHAGAFDVSHMGQAWVRGAGAAEFFGRITPSSFLKTPYSRAKYTVLTNDKGGIIDDLIITRESDETFFVVFNAGRKEVDIAWFKQQLPAGVSFEFLGEQALIALQGPKAEEVLVREMADIGLRAMPYMTMKQSSWPPALHYGEPGENKAAPKQSGGGKNTPVIISRLGYTGEDGFEISVPAPQAVALWRALLSHSEVKPIGLAARDSLRMEMGYPLYGHDLDESTTPVEASLSWVMSKGHGGFIGQANIASEPARKRVGIKLTEPGIAREGSGIFVGDDKIGTLTSGGFSPTLKMAIGQGYVARDYAKEGQPISVEVRGKKIAGEITPLAFLTPKTKSSILSPLPSGERDRVRGGAAN